MAEVVPFKGVLFNVPQISKVSGEDLLAPPYDIITPQCKEELYEKSPYNIVRIDFGEGFPRRQQRRKQICKGQKIAGHMA